MFRRNASQRIEPRLTAPAESRSIVDYGPGWSGMAMMASGRGAENLSTVLACVNAISSGIASLPATVYRAEGSGRVEAPNHPVARVLRAPNPHQTWPDFAEWLLASTLLRGNGLAVIERDGAGRPVALHPIPWHRVSLQRLPSGRLAYDVAAWTFDVVAQRYLESEVLHLRDRSDDGIVGISRISRAPGVIEAAEGLQTFSSAIWENAASPSGILTVPPATTKEGRARAAAAINERHAGAHNAKRIMIVDPDSTFTPISVSPEDAEVLASRKFSVIEVCRMFNVPPPIVQDYSNSTFTNASQASTWFATNTLTPLARKLEAEFSRSVFSDPAYHIEIDLSGLVRGDYATRWTANVAAVTAGILTVDEIRTQEGFGPLATPTPAP